MPIHNSIIFQQAAGAAGQPGPPPGPAQLGPQGLQATGPLLPVEVSLHPNLVQLLQQQGQPVPSPVTGNGLIDTGAAVTCVDRAVLTQLQIPPTGVIQVGTAAGPQAQPMHPATIRFPQIGFEGRFAFVIGADLSGQGIIVLIGRDVLSRALLVYNGTLGHFILSF